jgi:hypothetical protein
VSVLIEHLGRVFSWHNVAHVLGGTFGGEQPKQFVTFLDPITFGRAEVRGKPPRPLDSLPPRMAIDESRPPPLVPIL